MFYLKNQSKVPFTFEFTENPITMPSQFSFREGEIVEDGTEQVEKLKKAMNKNPNLKERLSKRYNLTIEPGQVVAFGEGEEYSEEQGEYVFRQMGGYAEQYNNGPEIEYPIVEVDADENVVRDNLHRKYRAKPSTSIGVQQASHSQFQTK